MRNFLLGGVAAFALMGAVSLVAAPRGLVGATADTYRQLDLFGEVFEKVRAYYIDQPKDEALIETALNGMLTSLDPHSSYLSPKANQEFEVQLRGEFGGLGIEVTMENGLVKVVAPIDDTPAAKAGLRSGDFITQLDGTQVLGLTLQEAVEKMRGPVSTQIKLTIQRAGQENPFDVTLARAVIRVQSVKSRREGNVGYVRITTFNEQANENLVKAVERVKAEIGPARVQGWILDLRDNPGGSLNQAIAVSDSFLNQGEIVSTRTRRGEDDQRFNAHRGDITDGKPVVVLINGGSASASEIVAGALQDHRRGVILGTKSFGKGSVQTKINLSSNGGAVKLTTARYYTPSGRSIQETGIDPDYVVLENRNETEAKKPRRSEADLRNHLRAETGPNSQAQAPKPPPINLPALPPPPPPPAEGQPAEDFQLLRGLDLVKILASTAQLQPK